MPLMMKLLIRHRRLIRASSAKTDGARSTQAILISAGRPPASSTIAELEQLSRENAPHRPKNPINLNVGTQYLKRAARRRPALFFLFANNGRPRQYARDKLAQRSRLGVKEEERKRVKTRRFSAGVEWRSLANRNDVRQAERGATDTSSSIKHSSSYIGCEQEEHGQYVFLV